MFFADHHARAAQTNATRSLDGTIPGRHISIATLEVLYRPADSQ